VAELSVSEDGEKMILEKLGTINGYRNGYISCEEYRLEFEQSMKKLRKKLNILSKFDENVPFMKWIGKFVLWDIIDYAKENDISQIELQKDITNEEFYEKVLGSLEEDNTIVEYEILWKLVCIYL